MIIVQSSSQVCDDVTLRRKQRFYQAFLKENIMVVRDRQL